MAKPRGIAAIAGAAAAALGAAQPALAQDAAVVEPAAVTASESGAVVDDFVPEDRPYSRREAAMASRSDEGRIVRVILHHGDDIQSTHLTARLLREREGIPAYALPGGESGQIEMFVNRKVYGRFSQRNLNRGDLGVDAYRIYTIETTGEDPFARERPVASLGGSE